jgi:hypothetical protein
VLQVWLAAHNVLGEHYLSLHTGLETEATLLWSLAKAPICANVFTSETHDDSDFNGAGDDTTLMARCGVESTMRVGHNYGAS